MGASLIGTGTGVGHRLNGFEYSMVTEDLEEDVEVVLSVELCREFRRKGREGRR